MSLRLVNPLQYHWIRPSTSSLYILAQRTIFHHEIIPKPKKLINPNPRLVRPESELKSIIQLDSNSPVLLHRLEEIRHSPVGWINRMIPPPRLPYNVCRNFRNRFDIVVEQKYKGSKKDWYTTLNNIEGDAEALRDVILWRLNYLQKRVPTKMYTKDSIEFRGFHRVTIETLLQGIGF